MILLKHLIYEIEPASKFDASKIYWEVKDEKDSLYIRMFIKGHDRSFVLTAPGLRDNDWNSSKNREVFGIIHLSKRNEGQKKGYVFVYNFQVEEPQKGYGMLIFRKALKETKKLGFAGIASEKEFRSADASYLWNKVRDFSDQHFDYAKV
jgi:hypothetical protein